MTPSAAASLNASSGLSALWSTLIIIAVFVLLTVLLLRSGQGYSVKDTESHATTFAGKLKEGHGGLPVFLWVTFGALIIWGIIYYAAHWDQFAVIFSH